MLFKTDKVAFSNFVELNDETEWLYWKLYILPWTDIGKDSLCGSHTNSSHI